MRTLEVGKMEFAMEVECTGGSVRREHPGSEIPDV
jgi:hypothetical protein